MVNRNLARRRAAKSLPLREEVGRSGHGHGKHTDRRRRVCLRLLVLLVALVLLIIYVDQQLHPIVRAFGENQAKYAATLAINEAVTQVLADKQLQYEDLIQTLRDEEGDIVSVEADVSKINRLKAEVTTAILQRLKQQEQLEMRIPLGNLFGSDWFNGRGPRLPLRVTVTGNALTTMHSSFSSAGINQTNHAITLEVEALIVTAIPGYTTSQKVETSFVVAETVLVGKVPDSFTEVTGDMAGDLGKIFAFGSEAQ